MTPDPLMVRFGLATGKASSGYGQSDATCIVIGDRLAMLLVFALSPKSDPFSHGWIKNHSYLCDDHNNNNVTDWPSFAGSIPVIIYHNTRSMRSQCVNDQHVNPLHCSYNLPFLIPMYENHYTLGLIKNRADRGTMSTSVFPRTKIASENSYFTLV
ncbi:hypothetical protein VNO77_38892 [Canavalia gladiata]|uniref:Uncharacterized protein n=1 Tax=Canavalia gladiata TaxID=3824 RepID=A0AAN9PZ75_CANGL